MTRTAGPRSPVSPAPRGARTVFDAAYYHRFYRCPATRVHDAAARGRLAAFVFGYLGYLGIPMRRVVDMGCGLGYWRREVATRHPRARYTGVEASGHLCATLGWQRGTVDGWTGRGRYDLVICQSVLQYLDDSAARKGIANLGRLCRGALFLEATTQGDWENNCDRKSTDGRVYLRTEAWYRRALSRHFRPLGGGLFLPLDSEVVLYDLEKAR